MDIPSPTSGVGVIIYEEDFQSTIAYDSGDAKEKKLTRKRTINKNEWKKNIAKQNRQNGKTYTNIKGKIIPAKTMKKLCDPVNCFMKCSHFVSEDARQNIFQNFWKLDDKGKRFFYDKYTCKLPTTRKTTKKGESRKSFTYTYNFEVKDILYKVCQTFFCGTLGISKIRIHYYHNNKIDDQVIINTTPKQGLHTKYCTDPEHIKLVDEHIKSFPVMDSHYCRKSTQKQYLSPELNLKKMYNLYVGNDKITQPVKFSMYEHIFNTKYNYSFFVPKKDICNKCSELDAKQKNGINLIENEIISYNNHMQRKLNAAAEKLSDKTKTDIVKIIFDLENVFALPRATTGMFYYKRKFAMYNLTGYCSANKTTYCSLWNEGIMGRSGDDIASALIKIIKEVAKDLPDTKKIILWSDSCVAQNKNSHISFALLDFLRSQKCIESIDHKYSEAGHSLMQEVDAVHSCIERHLRNIELFSPIGVLRLLKKMNYENVKLKLMQMQKCDFKCFSIASKNLNFTAVPYIKICQISYQADRLLQIGFKESFKDGIQHVSLLKPASIRKKKIKDSKMSINELIQLPPITVSSAINKISKEKKKDIMDMMKYMPTQDQQFNQAIKIE